jgi:YD repeat-containing protein
MSENEQAHRIETFLYDADGNRTEDESTAVRGEVVELDAEGRVIATHEHPGLAWKVDPISLEGDPGELATRPKRS